MKHLLLLSAVITCACNAVTGIERYYPETVKVVPNDATPNDATPDETLPSDTAPAPGDVISSDTQADSTDTTIVPYKRIFTTSAKYGANLGKLEGADSKCQALATTAKLPGTYKAWLSNTAVSAASRLTHSTEDYVMVDGTVVANGWTDLTSGSLLHAINVTEKGMVLTDPYSCVWTHTTTTGAIPSASGVTTCNGWTYVSSEPVQSGCATCSDAKWTGTLYTYAACTRACMLYCLEQ